MEKRYKFLRLKTSSWKKLRRVFYGRQGETFSDYIERIAKELKNDRNIKAEAINDIKFFRSGKAITGVTDIDSYIKWKFNLTEEDLK